MAAPVAPAAPFLEAAGTGKLRVRFAAPPAEPACSEMAVYLRTIGGGVPWRAVNGATHRLVIQEGTGSCVPMRLGDRELIHRLVEHVGHVVLGEVVQHSLG